MEVKNKIMAFKKVSYSENAKIATVEPIKSKGDIRRITRWFYEHDLEKYAVLFKVGCYTGLRISDILGLKVADCQNRTHVIIREQKTGKPKFFPLNERVRYTLYDYMDKQKLSGNDFIFCGRGGNKEVDRSQVYRFIVRACYELGIESNVGTHTMRKTFGYHHYRQFNDIALLQEIFNHSSPDVTLRYIGVTQDEINETYLKLDLEDDIETLDDLVIKKGDNRTRLRAVVSLCKNYIHWGGDNGVFIPFAKIILDLIFNTRDYRFPANPTPNTDNKNKNKDKDKDNTNTTSSTISKESNTVMNRIAKIYGTGGLQDKEKTTLLGIIEQLKQQNQMLINKLQSFGVVEEKELMLTSTSTSTPTSTTMSTNIYSLNSNNNMLLLNDGEDYSSLFDLDMEE